MPDNITTPETTTTNTNAATERTPQRIVKIGGATIVLDAAFDNATIDTIKDHLAQSGYPEAANATHTKGKNAFGDEIISFLPVAGRKG